MDFALPEELIQVRDSVRRFMANEARAPTAAAEAMSRFPREIIARMGEAGFFGAAFPEAVGGSNLGFQAVALIAEELSRVEPGYGYCMNLQGMTCPLTIFNWGTDAQIGRYVPDLIAGKRVGMFALSEPGGGSDPAGAMLTTARRVGERYVLSGSKMWITFADECDSGILFAKTDPNAGHRGISCFILEPKTLKGYRADPIAMSGLSRAFHTCAVFLDDVEVPVENRLGGEGEGFKIAMNALEYGRLTVAARLVGLAQACLDEATQYAKERVIKGNAIGRYQMVQHQIADMTVNVEAARLMVRRLAWVMDRGEASGREASQAKYFASLAAKHAAAAASEIFGGYALADAYPIQKFKGYIDMLNVGEGAPAVQRILIAEDTLGYKDANRHALKTRLRTRPKAAE
ncbi:MAG: acyl-CoA dehydrogenase family protein [Proteobacteria bacterium]|nr:acyl-CoA dehydrogenase family protein [Pseudomonadota bacterium]MBI3499107.1 acyl-CoA dehydrogenase family protein [Pseudomonadota bacterium]